MILYSNLKIDLNTKEIFKGSTMKKHKIYLLVTCILFLIQGGFTCTIVSLLSTIVQVVDSMLPIFELFAPNFEKYITLYGYSDSILLFISGIFGILSLERHRLLKICMITGLILMIFRVYECYIFSDAGMLFVFGPMLKIILLALYLSAVFIFHKKAKINDAIFRDTALEHCDIIRDTSPEQEEQTKYS